MEGVARWLDNPVLIKHVRSRLRRRHLLPSLVVVLILGLCILYGGHVLGGFNNGGAFGTLLALQGIVLAIMGATQVSASVGGARESGILDFHRVTPQPPWTTTLGFFLGAPIREYMLFAATLPVALACVALGTPGVGGFLQLTVLLVVSAWLLHALAMLNALVLKNPRSASRGAVVLVLLIAIASSGLIVRLDEVLADVGEAPTLSFFGVALPWLVVVLLYQVAALTFLLIATTRKMASERAHALSKPQAVACMAVVTVLVLGGLWDVPDLGASVLFVVYLLVPVAIVLTLTVTPSMGEFTKGLRRAEKRGRTHPRPWDDLALNRPVLAVLCGIVLVGSTIAWDAIEGRAQATGGPGAVSYSLAIAVGVLVVAYFGLAWQFFRLWAGKRALALFGLFLFLAWVVPVVLGAIAAAAGGSQGAGEILLALSPLAGIALTAGVADTAPDMAVRAAALVPALALAFLFNNLVTIAYRRAKRAVHRAPRAEPPVPVAGE
jgi:hypothetical protein